MTSFTDLTHQNDLFDESDDFSFKYNVTIEATQKDESFSEYTQSDYFLGDITSKNNSHWLRPANRIDLDSVDSQKIKRSENPAGTYRQVPKLTFKTKYLEMNRYLVKVQDANKSNLS